MNRFSLKQLKKENKLLIIGDIATNHCGDINHGLDIINSFHEVIKDYSEFYFSFKFQYRDIKNSFIHKHYKDRMDIKYVKRFTEGYLSDEEFLTLKNRVNELGYLTSCTPFDNISVQKIIEHDFDILKIGSVSMNDWILIEDIVKVNKPIIISTASHPLETINKLYSFMNHREKDFAFLHCRGIYPTPRKNMELNQIDLLKENFLNIPIGLSSHEDLFEGDSIVKIAVGKGVNILERHIDIDCKTKNAYSMTPKEMRLWLDGILEAQEICGIKRKRYKSSEKEQKDLAQFRRGLFAKEDLKLEDKLTNDNIYSAWPIVEDQVCANDFSKYTDFILEKNVKKDTPVMLGEVNIVDREKFIREIYEKIKDFILKSGVAIPEKFEIEISTHYGLDSFITDKIGAVIVTLFNREYAKKLLVLLEDMKHPRHFHNLKTETFTILYGDMNLIVYSKNNNSYNSIKMKKGDFYTVEKKVPHSFNTVNGVIFEEVSTEQFPNDSFYDDNRITNNKDRKTKIVFSA